MAMALKSPASIPGLLRQWNFRDAHPRRCRLHGSGPLVAGHAGHAQLEASVYPAGSSTSSAWGKRRCYASLLCNRLMACWWDRQINLDKPKISQNWGLMNLKLIFRSCGMMLQVETWWGRRLKILVLNDLVEDWLVLSTSFNHMFYV